MADVLTPHYNRLQAGRCYNTKIGSTVPTGAHSIGELVDITSFVFKLMMFYPFRYVIRVN